MIKIYRAIGNKKPSYLDPNCDHVALSEGGGMRIHFFPVRGHANSHMMWGKLREYLAAAIEREKSGFWEK